MKNQEEERLDKAQQRKEQKGKEKMGQKLNPNQMDEDDSSEWSLDSLEDIKGINIHQLEQQENNKESRQHQKPMLEAKFPEKPTFLNTAALHDIGKVIFVVGELLIVQANNGSFVVDLDNWVSDENKNLVGFVIDVLGKIETPYYAIKPEVVPEANNWLGRRLFYIEGTSKILKDDDIKSMQSKSAAEALQEVDDSSDQQIEPAPERKYSEQRRERKRETNLRRNQRWREDQMREESRDRTRERHQHNRHPSRGRNQHNQRYLQNMYNMHYNQMMRLYNGAYNPNPMPNMPNFFPSTMPTPPPNFNHTNIASFGSNQMPPPQFFGQSSQPPNNQGINFQAHQTWNGQKPEDQWQNPFGSKKQ